MKHRNMYRFAAGFTAAVQAAMLCAVLPVSAGVELNTNLMAKRQRWKLYTDASAEADYTAYNSINATITNTGDLDYSVQMYYNGLPLYQGGVYALQFDISSTVPRTAEVFLQENGGDYTAYFAKSLSLTEETQTVEVTFTMEEETDLISKFVLNCGNTGSELETHVISLNNASLMLIDDTNVDYSTFEMPEKSILLNQVGYLTHAEKTAVFRGLETEETFTVHRAETGETVYTGTISDAQENASAEEKDWQADFSEVTEPGTYYLESETCGKSDTFSIGDDVYNDLTDSMVRMFYLQRCGCEVEDETFGHSPCHTQQTLDYTTGEEMDVTGGWHDAGDYGRYVTAAAKAVADLLWAYQYNPSLFSDHVGIPESGNGVPDVLDEVRYELEWMQKMQDMETGGVHHKVTCRNFPGYIMPDQETDTLYVTPVSSLATADFAAVMAMAYQWYGEFDSTFAEECLTRAKLAWSYLGDNPSLVFTNPNDISTGTYANYSDMDERFWAAAALYAATGKKAYKNGVNDGLDSPSLQLAFDWGTISGYGYLSLLSMPEEKLDANIRETLTEDFMKNAASLYKTASSDAYHSSVSTYYWGSNMTIANNGFLLSRTAQLTGNYDYLDIAYDQLYYLLGKNATGYCFVSGFGSQSPQNPHHRPSMAVGQAMPGMLAGGVNQNLEDETAEAILQFTPNAKRYLDHSESYSTNEIAIYWNSPMILLLSVLTKAAEPIPGDMNSDRVVNGMDLALLRQKTLTGDAAMADVVSLQKFLLGIEM